MSTIEHEGRNFYSFDHEKVKLHIGAEETFQVRINLGAAIITGLRFRSTKQKWADRRLRLLRLQCFKAIRRHGAEERYKWPVRAYLYEKEEKN